MNSSEDDKTRIPPVDTRVSPYDVCKLTGPRSIRVLKLHGIYEPSSQKRSTNELRQPLVATLFETEFGNPEVQYDALSYPWGKTIDEDGYKLPGRNISIIVEDSNGAKHRFWKEIGGNLALALEQLRPCYNKSRREPDAIACRLIWVDALCINQIDEVEKSLQVSQMGNIYAMSQRTVAIPVPGLTLSGSKLARERFQDIACRNLSSKNEKQDLPRLEDLLQILKEFHSSWECLLASDYYTRAWVVQEIVLGPEVSILVAE
jgi:hypothetical protein